MEDVVLPGIDMNATAGVKEVENPDINIYVTHLEKKEEITEGEVKFIPEKDKKLWEAKFPDGTSFQMRCVNSGSVEVMAKLIKGKRMMTIVTEASEENDTLIDVQCVEVRDLDERMGEDYAFKDKDFTGSLNWLGGDKFELCVYKLGDDITLNHVLSWIPDSVKSAIKSGSTVYERSKGNRSIASEYLPFEYLDEFMEILPKVPMARQEIVSYVDMFKGSKRKSR